MRFLSKRAAVAGAHAALLATLLGGLTAFDDFREEILECEEAVAHLADCCPGFQPRLIECHYLREDQGCGGQRDERDPAISVDEARCVRGSSCADLVATHVCERAQAATPRVLHQQSEADPVEQSGAHAPVCP